MLGVLKRRWKPKRASNGNNRLAVDAAHPLDQDSNKPPRLVAPSVRQVHPVCDEKAQLLAYEKRSTTTAANNAPYNPEGKRASLADLNASPPPYPKRASLDSNPSPTYPLAPNICVEGGRIEFIKQSPDGSTGSGIDAGVGTVTPPTTPKLARITVTRGLQTEDANKCEDVQDRLEARILELESALDLAQKTESKDKQAISKLQKQLAKREATQRDADRERKLRADSESRAKQALQEAARARSRLKLLTSEFSRMEETVRSMLVYKKQAEQLRQEKAALTIAFENRCQQYQNTISRLNQEIFSLRQQVERSSCLNAETSAATQALLLQRHAEESRKQYERCLDDVANQVVKALVTQKGLKEEVASLNWRIQELEGQNEALTSMLVHQLRGDSPSGSEDQANSPLSSKCAVDDVVGGQQGRGGEATAEDNTSADASPSNLTAKNSVSFKHCNSFNSDVLDSAMSPPSSRVDIEDDEDEVVDDRLDGDKSISKIEKHLSADEILDTRLSLEDKKRHQVLTKLWTELKGTEVTPKRLIEALSAVDSALRVPPQRPVSLNLQLPILQAAKYRRSRPILAQSVSKSEEETGNESPESGNRDEGYSTMSSDVQAEVSRGGAGGEGATAPSRQPAQLEDLKEATDETESAETRLLATDNKDPDILYIPINLLNLKSRNSFPPGKDLLPFQHIMRSFSDSHLCIKITTAPTPCYTFSSPISSSPSILLLDITEKSVNPLRRTKATASLLASNQEESPNGLADERLECSAWDAEYIQHWLRLDESRSTLQQQHRDLLELEYDRAELEDWSLNLSSEDVREPWKKTDALTPGQISLATLPSIQENNALELEEDASECLWNSSSYMVDHEGHEIVALLMDAGQSGEKQWPYAVNYHLNLTNSPDNSWSSGASDYCNSHEQETCSKRSSAALSGCSDDTSELPLVGTDFTRDFYRLVKFESTKSLASTSSRSLGGALSEPGDRESALQNVLTFIAEQQKYVQCREVRDSRPCSAADNTQEFNIEAPPPPADDSPKSCDITTTTMANAVGGVDENYVTLKQLCDEFKGMAKMPTIAYAEEVCLVTPLDVETENCSNMSERPVDIASSVSVEYQKDDTSKNELSESLTSSVSTPETVVSKIPRRKNTKLSVNTSLKTSSIGSNHSSPSPESKILKSRIPHRTTKSKLTEHPQHVITSERLPQASSGVVSEIIDGPPHRAVSFHERATSKDVIDELNRMIRNGDESQENLDVAGNQLDEGCRPTGWIHVENDVDLNDPKTRASLLDVMMASVSSDSSPTSSCGGSVSSESAEEQPPAYEQLHRIHRFHRQKKAHAVRPDLAVVRASAPAFRPSIIGRQDFFVRYGEKEREAVASFDFLDEFSAGSSQNCSVDDEAGDAA